MHLFFVAIPISFISRPTFDFELNNSFQLYPNPQCTFAAMSGNSEYVTESGRRDSAYSPQTMQGPSLALLGSERVHPRIQDWKSEDDKPGLEIAEQAYTFPNDPLSVPRSLPDSEGSMAAMLQTSSGFEASFASSVPSLSSGSSIGSSSSIPSSAASLAIRPGLLDFEGCYIDAQSSNPFDTSSPCTRGVSCLFAFLGCEKIFRDDGEWYEHSKSHLQGRQPPNHLRCPYPSCSWATWKPDGETAWSERWMHLQNKHDVLGDAESLCEKRDTQLYDHLWRARLISAVQLQDLKRSGRLGTDGQPFVTTERSERYRHRQGKQTPRRPANSPRR